MAAIAFLPLEDPLQTQIRDSCIMQVALIDENLRRILEHLETKDAPKQAADWLHDLKIQSASVRRWIAGEGLIEPPAIVDLPLPKQMFATARRRVQC
jgi:hypothetical protein